MWPVASDTTRLPTTFWVISRLRTAGTPLESSVDSVRVKRAMA